MIKLLKHGWLCLLAVTALSLPAAPCFAQHRSIRLAMVNVPDDVVRPLLSEFQKETGLRAEIVYTGNDPFSFARAGRADLVIAHYGHAGVKPFVTGGWGRWPHTVFANQVVLLGPPDDPARVRGLTDMTEAFHRIAASKSPYISNDSHGVKYLEQILWDAAQVRDKGRWYLDLKLQGPPAVRQAARRHAYVLWGLPPYLRLKRRRPLALEPLVTRDPILQRIMVAIVVNPDKVPGVNAAGARAFQRFLIEPATQARIRAFRYPDFRGQAWWPAGRHNNPSD